jgi:hypothetical protein
MNLSRRSFLKNSAVAAIVSASPSIAQSVFSAQPVPFTPGPGNKWPGRVAVNFNKAAVTGIVPDEKVINDMVDASIILLTGKSTVGEAWKEIFPASLSLQSKIAIKIPLLNPGLAAPHPFSVMAIVKGLQAMIVDGSNFPAANITIYDANNQNPMDTAGYTAARFPGIIRKHYGPNNAQYFKKFGDGACSDTPYAPALNGADFLINVFSPRGHDDYAEKITLGFKSHYGTYPVLWHDAAHTPPYLRDINCTGPVFKKTVLSICSGIFGMNIGHGPTGGADNYSVYAKTVDPTVAAMCSPTTIIMSTDPISAEVKALKMMRINLDQPYDLASMPAYLKASAGVTGALSPTYNIGIIDEAMMSEGLIVNGVIVKSISAAVHPWTQNRNSAYPRLSASSLRGRHATFIEFTLPSAYLEHDVAIEIHDIKGALVRRLPQRVLGVWNHCTWDERDAAGNLVGGGTYIIHLVSGAANHSASVSLIR